MADQRNDQIPNRGVMTMQGGNDQFQKLLAQFNEASAEFGQEAIGRVPRLRISGRLMAAQVPEILIVPTPQGMSNDEFYDLVDLSDEFHEIGFVYLASGGTSSRCEHALFVTKPDATAKWFGSLRRLAVEGAGILPDEVRRCMSNSVTKDGCVRVAENAFTEWMWFVFEHAIEGTNRVEDICDRTIKFKKLHVAWQFLRPFDMSIAAIQRYLDNPSPRNAIEQHRPERQSPRRTEHTDKRTRMELQLRGLRFGPKTIVQIMADISRSARGGQKSEQKAAIRALEGKKKIIEVERDRNNWRQYEINTPALTDSELITVFGRLQKARKLPQIVDES